MRTPRVYFRKPPHAFCGPLCDQMPSLELALSLPSPEMAKRKPESKIHGQFSLQSGSFFRFSFWVSKRGLLLVRAATGTRFSRSDPMWHVHPRCCNLIRSSWRVGPSNAFFASPRVRRSTPLCQCLLGWRRRQRHRSYSQNLGECS